MIKALKEVVQRINCQDYSLKDIALYFEKYDGYTLEIETEYKTIKVKIYKNALPHLLGLQHVFKSREYKGEKGFLNILDEKITWKSLKNQINQNKDRNFSFNDLEKRISYLIMFFNTIEKRSYLKELVKSKLWRKTALKGNFILYKKVYEDSYLVYPMLSIKELNVNNYVIETFIVESDVLLIGGLNQIKVKNIRLIPKNEKNLAKC